MGTLFRRFWMPVLLSREVPEPDGPPVRVRSWVSIWWPFATRSVGSGWSRPGARTEGRTCGSGAMRSVASGASTTAGSSTLAGSAWKSPRWPAMTGYGPGPGSPPTRPASGATWSGRTWVRPGGAPLPESRFLRGAAGEPVRHQEAAGVQLAQACEGALDTAHFSFLHTPSSYRRSRPTGGPTARGRDAMDEGRSGPGLPRLRARRRSSPGGVTASRR